MPRNLDRRVEVAVPVADSALRARLDEIIDLSLADDALAWRFDGHVWERVPPGAGVNAQDALAEGATRRNRGVG
jgi:polyphosphate kinase